MLNKKPQWEGYIKIVDIIYTSLIFRKSKTSISVGVGSLWKLAVLIRKKVVRKMFGAISSDNKRRL